MSVAKVNQAVVVSSKVPAAPTSGQVPSKRESGYNASKFIKEAMKAGSALKASTVKANGQYPVNIGKLNGTSTVMTVAFIIAAGFKSAKEVASDAIVKVLDAFTLPGSREGKVLSAFIKNYEKETGEEYGNFGTTRTRIKKNIVEGGIITFLANDEEGKMDSLVKVAQAIK